MAANDIKISLYVKSGGPAVVLISTKAAASAARLYEKCVSQGIIPTRRKDDSGLAAAL
jgi:hypothetical protein